MSKIADAIAGVISFFLASFGLLLRVFPFALKRSFCAFLAWFWDTFAPFRRRVMLHNLALVFPRKNEESNDAFEKRCRKIAVKNFQHYLLMMLEIFERFSWSHAYVRSRTDWDHYERMAELRDSGKGFFFLSAHLGNWEALTRVGCAEDIRLTVITRFLRNPIMDRVWVRSRRNFGLDLLAESGSGLQAIKSVKRGMALGFMADQHTGEPHGIEAEFLGHPAWCPKALALMASRLKAPVLPIALLRDPRNGRFQVKVKEVLTFPKLDPESPEFDPAYRSGDYSGGRRGGSGTLSDEGIRYFIKRSNAAFEDWIRQYPEQYLWIHKRFKNFVDYNKDPLPWEL